MTNTKLAEALAQFEAALLFAYPEGARGAAFDCWNKARQALAAHEAEQALPLKDRPDFIAGYDAGLKDGRACERRDAAEQAAQAVPAGFKWVPVEPTLEMLTAAGREDDKAFVDGMSHGATAADVWAAMLAAAAPAPQAQAAGQDERAAFGAWFQGYRHGWKSEKDVTFDAWQARAALAQRQPLTLDAFDEYDLCNSFAGLPVEWFNPGPSFGATTGEQNK